MNHNQLLIDYNRNGHYHSNMLIWNLDYVDQKSVRTTRTSVHTFYSNDSSPRERT